MFWPFQDHFISYATRCSVRSLVLMKTLNVILVDGSLLVIQPCGESHCETEIQPALFRCCPFSNLLLLWWNNYSSRHLVHAGTTTNLHGCFTLKNNSLAVKSLIEEEEVNPRFQISVWTLKAINFYEYYKSQRVLHVCRMYITR